jgi:hypothetical protein
MRLAMSPETKDLNRFQQGTRNKFNINYLETISSNSFQQGLECGSEPGVGGRSSSLPKARDQPHYWLAS